MTLHLIRTSIMGGSLLVTLAVGSTTWAATFNPTRTDDPTPNGCQPADCSLREAVLAANASAGVDVIQLDDAVYTLGLNGNDTDVTGDLDVEDDLVIRGPGTIDAQGLGRIIEIDDQADVVFQQLVLQNANTSLATNGSLNGGAVLLDEGRLTVRASEFRNNQTQSLGGGIYSSGDGVLIVEDTLFFANEASSGSGIFGNEDVSVRNSRFIENRAEQRGAALYLSGTQSDVVLERISLIDNESEGSGGGAILFLGRDLQVDNLLATGNRVPEGNGGVIATTGTAHAKSVRISNAIFADNLARNGGVLSLADDDDPVEIAHVAFIDNQSGRQGGAVYVTGGVIDIANATFSGNEAGTDGGAIHLFGETLTLRHITMTGGTADRGSALSIGGSSAISSAFIANSIIEGNCRLANAGTLSSLGGNVESPDDTCALEAPSDQDNVSAMDLGLRPRQGTTGATPSHPLERVSAARGAGVSATCDALPLDQLFRTRPSACSAGAVGGGFVLADGFDRAPALGARP